MQPTKVQLTLLLDWIGGQSLEDATRHLEDTYGVQPVVKWRNAPFVYVTVDTDEATLTEIKRTCQFVYGWRETKE